ncbi:hypothetical protein M434DRAFT_378080 [Hypoxylon sp. CO27-5]|nr:hypothetical protein M434DRAFT_378080 [Hypoxylon sp. CO27-5]
MTAPIIDSKAQISALPDFMNDPNAVLKDIDAQWRNSQPPDYTRTRKFYSETKQRTHEAGSLPELVENLVKNWEIEASFKTRLSDWRTIDPEAFTFAVNNVEPCSAEHMLRVGTYNAVIAPCEYYDPANSDFAASHKTFKRMMPAFAWEVLEVHSGPPVVCFRWRHWGEMKNDYVGRNSVGDKVTVKANGQLIDIQGVTVAHLNNNFQVTELKTYFDSNEMFRQIDPQGVVMRSGQEGKGGTPATDVKD